MTISLIAAMGRNRVIGNENKLIWDIPEDMKHFRELTRNKPVIMGRKTFESIGKPLPNRTNIIITHDKNYKKEGCVVVHSVKDSLKAAEGAGEIMVIGGSQIYREFLPIADKIYLTIIDEDFDGDAAFPEFSKSEWKISKKEELKNDKYKFTFIDYEKVKPKKIYITVDAVVDAPVEKTWEFWTMPSHITKWNNASGDWHTPFAENDLRKGGKFLCRMEAKDKSAGFDFNGVYDNVINHKLIAYTIEGGRKVTIAFERLGNRAKITETFEAETTNPIEMQKSGWQAILNNFKKYAETNKNQ